MKSHTVEPLTLSYEFFPPKSEKSATRFWQAFETTDASEGLPEPAFHSITYGALGANRDRSVNTVLDCQSRATHPVAAHITAAGQSKREALEIAETWYQNGIDRLVVLRGDAAIHPDGFKDAVELIKGLQTVGDFDISVAAYPDVHPKAESREADLDVLSAKFEAGANRAITQFFFDVQAFLRLREDMKARGLEQKLVPGILPIQNIDKILAFCDQCGATIPDYIHKLFQETQENIGDNIGSDEAQQQLGVDLATFLCADLMSEGVRDFHFYTLNTGHACRAVVQNLTAKERIRWPNAA